MNVHHKYNTINHIHFDLMVRDHHGEKQYPSSALMLVETGTGQWFLEQEFGKEFNVFPGVIKSRNDVETEPDFYPSMEAAARAAFSLMKQLHPSGYDEEMLEDFLADQ